MQAFAAAGGDFVQHSGLLGQQADRAAEEVGIAAVAQRLDQLGGVARGGEVGELDGVVVGELEQPAVQLGLEAGAEDADSHLAARYLAFEQPGRLRHGVVSYGVAAATGPIARRRPLAWAARI